MHISYVKLNFFNFNLRFLEPIRRSKRTVKGDSAPESAETTVKRENKRKVNLKVERVADSDKEKFDSEDGESEDNEDAVDDLPKNNRSLRSRKFSRNFQTKQLVELKNTFYEFFVLKILIRTCAAY